MSKQKLAFVILVGLLLGCGTIVAQAPLISIPIVNADFEAQDVTGGAPITDPAGCGTFGGQGAPAGWGIIDLTVGPGRGVAHWTCDDGMPPSNVALIQGAAIYQVTPEKARQGVYIFEFDVSNWFYPYPGDWNGRLYQASPDPNGSIVDNTGNRWTLSPAPFCSESAFALGDMKRVTVTCPLTGYLLQVTSPDPLTVAGQNPGGYVVVYIQNGAPNPALGGHAGWSVKLDNVSLRFSPQL